MFKILSKYVNYNKHIKKSNLILVCRYKYDLKQPLALKVTFYVTTLPITLYINIGYRCPLLTVCHAAFRHSLKHNNYAEFLLIHKSCQYIYWDL